METRVIYNPSLWLKASWKRWGVSSSAQVWPLPCVGMGGIQAKDPWRERKNSAFLGAVFPGGWWQICSASHYGAMEPLTNAPRKTTSSWLQSHGAGGKILQQSGEEPSGCLDQALTPPYLLIFFCQELSHVGSQGDLFGCTSLWQPITRGFCRGWTIRVGFREQFSLSQMGCRAKRNLFLFPTSPMDKKIKEIIP